MYPTMLCVIVYHPQSILVDVVNFEFYVRKLLIILTLNSKYTQA